MRPGYVDRAFGHAPDWQRDDRGDDERHPCGPACPVCGGSGHTEARCEWKRRVERARAELVVGFLVAVGGAGRRSNG